MTRRRDVFAARYRRGVLATLPALLASSAASVLFNWPWLLEPVAERVMMLTPVDLSQQLLLRLGTYARPLALFGAVAILIAIGGCVSVLAGDLDQLYAGLRLQDPLRRVPHGSATPTAVGSAAQNSPDRLEVHGQSSATVAEDRVEPTAVGVVPAMRPQSQAPPYAVLLRAGLALCFLSLVLFVLFRPLAAAPALIFIAVYLAILVRSAHGERDRPVAAQASSGSFNRPQSAWRYHGVPAAAGPAVGGPAAVGGPRAGRRAFLSDSARILAATGALVALLLIGPWYRDIAARRRGGRLFAFRVPPRPPGFSLSGLTPEVTPPDAFYTLSKNLVDPDLPAEGWMLRVDGLVARPLALSFADLLALPARTLWVTQECVSNPVGGPLISCGLFIGVPVRRLLLRAGPLAAAARLVMRAPDGHADSIPLSLAMHPDVLVAYGMDGAYLTRAHGFPARILIPGSYGFKSVKWVTHLELVDHQFKGTWQELGWTDRAIVQTTARIDLARRAGTGLLVAGIAFAGARGIRAVQVRADRGAWVTARLHTPPLSPLTWVQWRVTLPLTSPAPATIMLEARAIDGTGVGQTARQRDIYPAGATGYHRVTVTV